MKVFPGEKNPVFNWGGTFRFFHGSLIQSGLDLKALNRNKPGTHGNRLDLATAFLMLIFQSGFVLLLHYFLWNCGISGPGFWYTLNWRGVCVCMWVCKEQGENQHVEKSWNSLKLHCIENGKLDFLQSFCIRRQIHDLHVIVWTECGGLSSAERYVFLVHDKTGSQDLTICERSRSLLLNWCVGKEGAEGLGRVDMRRNMQSMCSVHQW